MHGILYYVPQLCRCRTTEIIATVASKAGEIGLNLYDLSVGSLYVNEQAAKYSINKWWERQGGAAAQPSEEVSAYKKALVSEGSPPELTIQVCPHACSSPERELTIRCFAK